MNEAYGVPLPGLEPPPIPEATEDVARVMIDASLPHLDRPFEYAIPEELREHVRSGCRVRIRFAQQEREGYVTAIVPASEAQRRARNPLLDVVGSYAVLTPAVFACALSVAERYVGTLADVLRAAIPPRVARVEKEFLAREHGGLRQEHVGATAPDREGAEAGASWTRDYAEAASFLQALSSGASPRAAWESSRGFGASAWHRHIAEILAACHFAGRGALFIVPTHDDLDALCRSVEELLGPEHYVRLAADDGKTPRYRAFLQLLTGERRIALGMRGAIFAPVQHLGFLGCWDDGDELHREQRAPYHHVRDVALLRSRQENTALLFAAHSRSVETQRLVERQWLGVIRPQERSRRQRNPLVVSTSDSFEQARDPLALTVRIPHKAWVTARQALEVGPVLIQVARSGYATNLRCNQCDEPARCAVCSGPYTQNGTEPRLACSKCGHQSPTFRCRRCGTPGQARSFPGVLRTVEELGRAFPRTSVVYSTGEHRKVAVANGPALVVATVGAEPVAVGGYAAALLLDGDVLMSRVSMRAEEETVRRWFNALALVRSAEDGGVVVCTASPSAPVTALMRCDPSSFSRQEVAERERLHLPPAVRVLRAEGSLRALQGFIARLEAPQACRVLGPSSVPGEEHRLWILFPYAVSHTLLHKVRAMRSLWSAERSKDAVSVRCDGDLL